MGTLTHPRKSQVQRFFGPFGSQSVAPWRFPKVWFRCAPIGRSLGVGRYPWCFMVNFRLRNPKDQSNNETHVSCVFLIILYTLLSTIPSPPQNKINILFTKFQTFIISSKLKSMLFPPQRSAIAFVASRFGGFGECVFSGRPRCSPVILPRPFLVSWASPPRSFSAVLGGDGVIITRGFDGGKWPVAPF